jgi:hypothetical protein
VKTVTRSSAASAVRCASLVHRKGRRQDLHLHLPLPQCARNQARLEKHAVATTRRPQSAKRLPDVRGQRQTDRLLATQDHVGKHLRSGRACRRALRKTALLRQSSRQSGHLRPLEREAAATQRPDPLPRHIQDLATNRTAFLGGALPAKQRAQQQPILIIRLKKKPPSR